ncbi:MAG: restriction endonuclease subunit S, partial [Planktothrix sp.]
MRQNIFLFEQLGNLIQGFEGGINFPPVPEGEAASEWRVLKISAVTWGEFNPYESKPINPNVVFDDSLIVRQGDLLMSRANTTELVGAVCLVRNHPPKLLLPDKIWRIKFTEKSKLLPEYALYALRSPALRKIIGDLATGSSGSMKNISMEKAATLPIPLPPLTEQKRMAAIAQKADRLRRTRRYTLQLSDTFLQSIFLEMFGDPEINPKNWDIEPFEEVCAIDAEMVDPKIKQYHKYLHIGGANVESTTGKLLDLKTAEEEGLISGKFLINPQHILFSKIRPKLRKVAFPRIHALCSADIYPITIKSSKCNPYFLLYYLRSDYFSKIVSELAESRTNIPKVNREELAEQSIPLPPLPLQEKFAQIVQKFERLRTQQREAERQAEHLFQTILHRAFRGELTS